MTRRQGAGAYKSGPGDPQYDRLATLNKSELKQVARDMGIPNSSAMNKAGLIAAIKWYSV